MPEGRPAGSPGADPRLRSFQPEDYEAIVEVYNLAHPADVTRAEADRWRHLDEHRDARYKSRRRVVEVDGRIVGFSHSRLLISLYHPRKFFVEIAVRPDFQGRGLGSRLHDAVLAELTPDDPLCLRAQCRADMEAGVRFLEKRGYREEQRTWESHLDLDDLDPGPLESAIERAREQGFEIRSVAELRDDPDWQRKYYDLMVHVERDMPSADQYTPPSFEELRDLLFQSSFFVPEASFLALDRGRYVGISNLVAGPGTSREMLTDTTGVHRDYRRRGLASALKARAILWAKERGVPLLRTWNDAENRPMLEINDNLGFRKYPAWIGYIKTMGEG